MISGPAKMLRSVLIPVLGLGLAGAVLADAKLVGDLEVEKGASDVKMAPSQIDELVSAKLKELHIQPAPVCSDEVFVRRVYLDVIGTIPTAQEAKAFLQDKDPQKRTNLIDRLMDRDEYGDYWTMKWSDLLRIKAEFPVNLWPNAAQTYYHWVRSSVRDNKPYDQFARELLCASGSNFRDPPANFYRAVQNKDAQGLAQAVALLFMGERAENWPKEKLTGMSGFFAQMGYKGTSEWKEEIVFYDASKAAKGLPKAVYPEGKEAKLVAGKDPRVLFADWLIRADNPSFARNIVDREWSWLMGRGIIHEPDDIRPDNPPVNPQLLAYLERELVTHKYDLRHIQRLILNSQTYQRSSCPAAMDAVAEANFAYYPMRRLDAEVLADAICQITGTSEKYTSAIPEPFTYIPEGQRSITLPDGSISSAFLEMFGRPARDTGLESERNNKPTAAQRLFLLNSSHIQRKIEQGPAMQALLVAKKQPREMINDLYLTIMSRFPTDQEAKTVVAYVQSGGKAREAMVDVAWALINSAEFMYRH